MALSATKVGKQVLSSK